MKTIFLKSLFIIGICFTHISKAQSLSIHDYIKFYNGVVPKLTTIAPNKTQFYGQNFSKFNTELNKKYINIVGLDYDSKTDTGKKYYILRLFLCDSNMDKPALDNRYQIPWITITFEDEIPPQIKSMVQQYHGEWNNTFVEFFSNMKIEKIKFVGVKGYNNSDWSGK
ncbi:hypothetical protein [Chryseobacterium jejuense]|uniref:Uncharacterized protein n=1 Tax=Chryseobacterium jejuense TaxID=445960 RepID=A0A2X2WRM9_CHRJE|nr:hypothetical protein [Chryseobacterium jejuense]SDJ39528.1 hypothetical protein SAMN05421542_3422 [Chryseobacterium jejuense]SQB45922.1 Uncharacterised protein [Chryseobacterium jejuense]